MHLGYQSPMKFQQLTLTMFASKCGPLQVAGAVPDHLTYYSCYTALILQTEHAKHPISSSTVTDNHRRMKLFTFTKIIEPFRLEKAFEIIVSLCLTILPSQPLNHVCKCPIYLIWCWNMISHFDYTFYMLLLSLQGVLILNWNQWRKSFPFR